MKKEVGVSLILGAAALALASEGAFATCGQVSPSQLQNAANNAVHVSGNGGFNLDMWVTMVDETGKVCQVYNTAANKGIKAPYSGASWLGSRDISAQKANTANAFSLDGYAISTANLYESNQPGKSLFGLQFSNPIDGSRAYLGSPNKYGTKNDPLKGKRIGGVNVFGGGLALYSGGKKIGAIGVSGDTSCTDHAVAWRIRTALNMQPGGVGITTVNFTAVSDDSGIVAVNNKSGIGGKGTANDFTTNDLGLKGDEMIIINNDTGSNDQDENWAGWAHPQCPNTPSANASGNTGTGIILVKNANPT